MSITFPSALSKPSEIEANLPNAMVRPTFDKLYGFDVPQGDVIDGAIFTEGGEPMITEANDILIFE